MPLSRLKRVDLRDYWKHEALDFTRWLAEPDNIALLSDEVGLDIEGPQIEASVGRFSVDVLAQEEKTGRKIIIENQLEITDHSHLGQLITYAAGLEAEFVVWIVREVREEHRQAVDWLNEHTDDKINFFLVGIELWQIENSLPAPKFTVISRPNEWRRAVRTSVGNADVTDTKMRQMEFWQGFKDYVATNAPKLKLRTPRPQHWFDVSIGSKDCNISLVVDSRLNNVRCDLYIYDSKALFRTFFSHKAEIEQQLGLVGKLEWLELPNKKASRIVTVHDFVFSDTSTWDSAFAWLLETTVRFKEVFGRKWEAIPEAERDSSLRSE